MGTLISAGLIQGETAGLASAGLGAALVVYAVLGLSAVRFQVAPSAEPCLGPTVGLTTGLVTGMTGVFVIPAVPYLAGLGLAKDELIQALGLSFTVSTLALVPALAGMAFGSWVRGRISEGVFRQCFFLGLLGLGFYLGAQVLV